MKNKHYIAVVAPRRGLGDCVSFFGIFKAIYKNQKKKIILLTHKNTSAKEIFKNQNIFEEIIYIEDTKKSFISKFKNYISLFKTLRSISLKANNIIILHQSLKYVILSRIVGFYSVEAVGQKFQRYFIKINRVYKNFFSQILHPRDESEILIKKIFNLKKIEENYFSLKFCKKNYVAIGVATSGYSTAKNPNFWGFNNYIKVINFLIDKGYKNFLLLSGKDQADLENDIIKYYGKHISFIKTSNLSVVDIMSYIKKVIFYFGNDTGFSHLCVSYKIPSLILHGWASPHKYSRFIYPIVGVSDIFSNNAIKTISFIKVKEKIKYFLEKKFFI